MNKFTFLLSAFLVLTLSCSDYSKDLQAGSPTGGVTPTSTNNVIPADLLTPNEGPFSEKKMLVNLGLNIIAKNVHEFSLQAPLMESRIDLYCQDLDDRAIDAAPSEKVAKDQWETTMMAYHEVEVTPVGPLSDNSRFLADNIYAWPSMNVCGIDEEVAKFAESGKANPQLLVNVKGLGAIEYLLFEKTLTPQNCSSTTFPEATAWAQKPALEKKRDRCHFARLLAKDVAKKSAVLEQAWAPDKGNFTKTLIDGSRYKKINQAMNAMSDAIFTIETLKDQKLSRPIGFDKICDTPLKKCPEMAEHPWSGLALEAMTRQLLAFKKIFWGSLNPEKKSLSFDDYLINKNHPNIAPSMLEMLDQSIDEITVLSKKGSLQSQIDVMDPVKCAATDFENVLEPLCAMYIDVRIATMPLKTTVLLVLSLQLPADFQGDSD